MPADAATDGPVPGGQVQLRREAGGGGQALDRVLPRHPAEPARTRFKQLILAGDVTSDGAVQRDPAQRVQPGQHFWFVLPEPADPVPAAQAIPLAIRFEDEHLIVVDKPAGLVVHPAPGNPEGTLVNALLAHCGDSLAGIGGVRRPGIVHRLDKDTSGLLVVAKTELAHRALSRDFAGRRIERAYSAFVWGVPVPTTGEISGNIGRSPRNRKKMAVVPEGRGRSAVTRYHVERRYGDHAALIECRLLTGRTHQIRVHLSHAGHPLIGDPVYGTRSGRAAARLGLAGASISAFPRQALHARLLGFTHPATSEKLRFESPLPADLAELTRTLELL